MIGNLVRDYFDLLNVSRQPWLDPDALKESFLALSAELHPDRVHAAGAEQKQRAQERYAELNAAYQCLREPKDRLRYLLELELGRKLEQMQSIPAALMDLSLEVGRACRETDIFLTEKTQATSPLLQVEMFERGQERTERLTELLKKLALQRDSLTTELKQLDANWKSEGPSQSALSQAQVKRLEQMYRLFSYYERWIGQLRERIVRLAL